MPQAPHMPQVRKYEEKKDNSYFKKYSSFQPQNPLLRYFLHSLLGLKIGPLTSPHAVSPFEFLLIHKPAKVLSPAINLITVLPCCFLILPGCPPHHPLSSHFPSPGFWCTNNSSLLSPSFHVAPCGLLPIYWWWDTLAHASFLHPWPFVFPWQFLHTKSPNYFWRCHNHFSFWSFFFY